MAIAWNAVSRPLGPFAPIQAAEREHYYEPRRSSRLLGQELLLPTAPPVETGTFTRTVVWSKNPDAWLVEVRDAEGGLVGVEIADDAQDVFLLLDEHLIPPDAA